MHQIIDFRGFKDVSIDLMRSFTLLIGPNGSGKTNVIEAIERRDLLVLVTTHNPATMNNLTPEQMKGVVLCTSSAEKQTADLVDLDSLPRSDELLERGQLGDLVSRRVIEQYLAPEFEEQHRQKMLKWVTALP